MQSKFFNYSIEAKEEWISEDLIKEMGLKNNKNNKKYVSTILANVAISEESLCVSLGTHKPIKYMYNPQRIMKGGIIRVLKEMETQGYIKIDRGFKIEGYTKSTEVAITHKLEKFTKEVRVIRPSKGTEFVIVKGKAGLENYYENELTKTSRSFLKNYNLFIGDFEIQHPQDEIFNRAPLYLIRIFRDHEKNLGGRMYGHWQNLRSKSRHLLTIDGEETTELDFQAMNIAILYRELGKNVVGDPYKVSNPVHQDPIVNRKLIKTLTLCMLATTRIDYACKALIGHVKDEFTVDYKELKCAAQEILENNKPIADQFFQGKVHPLVIQFKESEICLDIVTSMMSKGVLVLPVHDSFICQKKHEAQLREAMIDAFQNKFGVLPTITKKG